MFILSFSEMLLKLELEQYPWESRQNTNPAPTMNFFFTNKQTQCGKDKKPSTPIGTTKMFFFLNGGFWPLILVRFLKFNCGEILNCQMIFGEISAVYISQKTFITLSESKQS